MKTFIHRICIEYRSVAHIRILSTTSVSAATPSFVMSWDTVPNDLNHDSQLPNMMIHTIRGAYIYNE